MDVKVLDLDTAQFKAGPTVATGLRVLEFYAAAFSDVPDLNGDIVDPRAFDGWLPRFYKAGKPLPISFSHSSVLDSLDPTNVIGYAPADPDHVWVDDYGLRVKAFLEVSSEKGKAVEWQIEQGIIQGASMAYRVAAGGRVKEGKMFRIKAIDDVGEAGPTPNPANQAAVLLWLKTNGHLEESPDVPYMTVDEFRETVLKTETPVEPEPEPDPVDPRSDPLRTETEPEDPEPEAPPVPDLKHQASPAYLQNAHDALVRAGAKCAPDEPVETSAASESDDVASRVRRLRFLRTSLT